jgi:uncharacterized protein (DUF3820 family)
MIFSKTHLVVLANYKMPFGRYKGQRLLFLPEAYFVWFAQKGWPQGTLGNYMRETYELKSQGLEDLLRPLVER